ncbi:MAG: bifunctional (p)ppGpp synthetase/guanosine-3',5'-bis(diphosphate) 3'-pyrophosphohydrolase [Pseudomonadota bacterium]
MNAADSEAERLTITGGKAKSGLAAEQVTDGSRWLELVTPGRSAADRALLEAVCAAVEKCDPSLGDDRRRALTGGPQAGGLEEPATNDGPAVRSRAYRVGQILHDLQMDVETVAAGTLSTAGVPARELGPMTLGRDSGAGLEHLLGAVERLQAVPELLEGPRDQAQLDRLRRLFLTLVSDVRAALVILAEWLHVMRELVGDRQGARKPMTQLTFDVYAPLASRLGVWQVKWELEDLAFRHEQPERYKQIARQLAERRVDRESYVRDVVATVRRELGLAGIEAQVVGRPKHIYSIWRKMQAKSLQFDDLFDVRAVRIVTDTVANCYAALGVVHSLWTHVPREFDDYIASPKPNRYQSLHTAVVGPEDRTVEVQIRTGQMHRDAELGVAAHWRYKEGADGSASADERLAWLREALEWREKLTDGELQLQLRQGLGGEQVYALTPQGRVIELPNGATPLDFAYRVHTDIGHRCRGARVNGRIVALTTQLVSGDTVEVLTSRASKPSRDWLNRELGYLQTARARSKVRHWFRQLDYAENVADGREAWERELRRLRLPPTDLQEIARHFNFVEVRDLYAAMGRGEVHLGQVANLIRDSLPAAPATRRVERAPARQERGVVVDGVGDLLVQVAQCCTPVPPEPIMGYITRGRGVTVHRDVCPNLLRLMGTDSNRVIEVQWGGGGERHTVEVMVKAYDRRGLLRDVSAVVANANLDVRGLDSHTDERTRVVTMKIRLDVRDAAELSRVVGRLLQVRNVFEALRHG